MAEQQSTMYRDMEPEEITRKYWAADYIVDLVSMVGLGLIIIAAAWAANMGQTWAFIPATIVAFIVFVALNARRLRNFAGLQGILMVDCDSQKMERVCELSAKRTKKGAERVRFRTLHGMAQALNGKPDDALEMVGGIHDKLQAADALNVKSVRAAAYRMKGDTASAEAMVNEVQAIHDGLPDGNPLKGAAGYLLAQLDFAIALDKGDWEQAEHALEHVENQAAAPERLVEAAYSHALLLDAQGKPDEARPHFEEVAAKGGTLAIRDKARDWLDAHPGQGKLEA
ncbi:MAG: tetratricopeptide repeat protein [Coriobacteriaceae bacterium]|nr:tetratricopeptide repeat protein [Coriobacteriaceae bacterium]